MDKRGSNTRGRGLHAWKVDFGRVQQQQQELQQQEHHQFARPRVKFDLEAQTQATDRNAGKPSDELRSIHLRRCGEILQFRLPAPLGNAISPRITPKGKPWSPGFFARGRLAGKWVYDRQYHSRGGVDRVDWGVG